MTLKNNAEEILHATQLKPRAKTQIKKPRIKTASDIRKRKLALNILQGKSVKQSAIDAGYSPNTAHGKTTQLKEIANKEVESMLQFENLPNNPFFDIPILLKEYKHITEQRKDYGTKYKAISRVLGQYENILPKENETNSNQLPQLNIVVREINLNKNPKTPILNNNDIKNKKGIIEQ